jgi:hypothetical protein
MAEQQTPQVPREEIAQQTEKLAAALEAAGIPPDAMRELMKAQPVIPGSGNHLPSQWAGAPISPAKVADPTKPPGYIDYSTVMDAVMSKSQTSALTQAESLFIAGQNPLQVVANKAATQGAQALTFAEDWILKSGYAGRAAAAATDTAKRLAKGEGKDDEDEKKEMVKSITAAVLEQLRGAVASGAPAQGVALPMASAQDALAKSINDQLDAFRREFADYKTSQGAVIGEMAKSIGLMGQHVALSGAAVNAQASLPVQGPRAVTAPASGPGAQAPQYADGIQALFGREQLDKSQYVNVMAEMVMKGIPGVTQEDVMLAAFDKYKPVAIAATNKYLAQKFAQSAH